MELMSNNQVKTFWKLLQLFKWAQIKAICKINYSLILLFKLILTWQAMHYLKPIFYIKQSNYQAYRTRLKPRET